MIRTAGKGSLLAIACAVAVSACGSRAGGSLDGWASAAPVDRACPRSSADRAPDTLRVGLLAAVDAGHAPGPTNRAEAIVFRHLYGTLVRFDCRGDPHPGLAESWTAEDGMRRWEFELREDARFWDGAPVTADDVRASWMVYGAADRLARDAGLPRDSIRIRGARTLVLSFTEPRPDALLRLADPGTGVARPQAASRWPVGTGSHRVVRARGSAERGWPRIELATVRADGTPAPPVSLEILLQPGADGRDLVDRGVHILIAEDPAAIEYAASHPAYRTFPLVWDRAYILVVPGARVATGGPASRSTEGPPRGATLPTAFVEALTRHVVPADVRPIPTERIGFGACVDGGFPEPVERRSHARGTGIRPDPKVVYVAGDAIGRAIAERLVALAAMSGQAPAALDDSTRAVLPRLFPDGGPLQAEAASHRELRSKLAEGEALAYVGSVAAGPIGSCGSRAWPGRWSAFPLVETRAHAIVREGAVDLRTDSHGTPVLGAAAREDG